MPYVDSALLLPIGTSLLFLLWLSFCGAVLVRFCCSIRSWTLLPPLGLAAGCAIFLVCANLLGYFRSVPFAFGGAFLLLSALGIFASFRLWPRSWQLPSRQTLLAVCGYSLLALVLAYVCLAIRNQSYFYDFPTHLAFATTIARDNLPVRNPYSPVSPSGYHYGAALLVAALSRAAGLPAVTGYQLLAALQGAALLLLVFALGREAGKHFLWGLACLLAALSMGSLVLWWPFAALPPALSHLLGGNLSLNTLLQFPNLRNLYRARLSHRLFLFRPPLALDLSPSSRGLLHCRRVGRVACRTRAPTLGPHHYGLIYYHRCCRRPLR